MSTETGAAGALSGVGSTARSGARGFLALAGIAEHVEGSGKGDHWAQAGLVGDGMCLAQGYLRASWATPIIAAGLTALTAYSLACGFPFTPDKGDKFANGAAKFGDVGHALEAAQPTEEWTGSGSDTYLQRSRDQLERAQRMAGADDRLRAILADQAAQVSAARDAVDHSATILGIAIPFAVLLATFGPIGILDSELFQISSTASALGYATPAIEKLMGQVAANAARILNVADEYSRVAADASLGGSVAGFGPSATDVASGGTPRPTNPPAAKPGPQGTPPSGGGAPTADAPSGPTAPSEALPDGPSAASGGGGPSGVAPGVGATAGGAATLPPAGVGAPAVSPASAGMGAPSGGLPGLPGAVPGGGSPGLLASMLGPATQAATQALGQTGQGATPAPAGAQSQPSGAQPSGAQPSGAQPSGAQPSAAVPGGAPGQGAAPGTRPAGLDPEKKPLEAVREPASVPADHTVADGAGPGGQGARAPIRVEIELDPDQLTAPVHVVLDPKNTTPGSPG